MDDKLTECARENTRLENVRARMDEITSSINDAAVQIHNFITDLHGPQVSPKDPGGADATERPGRVGAIEDAVDRLANSREDLHDALRAFRELNL